MRRANSIFY